MTFPQRFHPYVPFALLALALVVVEWAVIQSEGFVDQPKLLAPAVTFDLAAGLPALAYLLLVRRNVARPRFLLTVFTAALALTFYILPTQQRQAATLLRYALMAMEVGIVGFILLRSKTILTDYRQRSERHPDFIANLTASLQPVFGNGLFTTLLVREISVWRYGLFGWAGGIEKASHQTAFTTYRTSGQLGFTLALLLICTIEMVAVHLVIAHWSVGWAWLISTVSLYGMLFFVADYVATTKRPMLLDNQQLLLRFGLRGQYALPLANVERVKYILSAPEKNAQLLRGTFLIQPNVLLTLREPWPMIGLLGQRRHIQTVTLFVDDIAAFSQRINTTL